MRGDQRQRSRNHQRRPESLRHAGENQLGRVRRKRTSERSDCEQRDAEGVDTPQPIAVTRRAAEQQEGGKDQRVTIRHPLHFSKRGVQRGAHLGNGDGDDASVGESHARADDGRRQHAALQRRHRRTLAGRDSGAVGSACSINRLLWVAISPVDWARRKASVALAVRPAWATMPRKFARPPRGPRIADRRRRRA